MSTNSTYLFGIGSGSGPLFFVSWISISVMRSTSGSNTREKKRSQFDKHDASLISISVLNSFRSVQQVLSSAVGIIVHWVHEHHKVLPTRPGSTSSSSVSDQENWASDEISESASTGSCMKAWSCPCSWLCSDSCDVSLSEELNSSVMSEWLAIMLNLLIGRGRSACSKSHH